MARYRIHRMKDTPRESFRWAAHTAGWTIVKARDYEASGEVEAPTPYAAWRILRQDVALRPGDLLETLEAGQATGNLQIVKYVGFEPATWYVAETRLQSGMIAGTGPNGTEQFPPSGDAY